MSRNTRIAGAVVAIVVLAGCTTTAASTQAPTTGPTKGAVATTTVPSLAARAKPTAAAKPEPTDIVLVPPEPFPTPAGAAVPDDLLRRTYAQNPPEILDGRQLVLTLRPADDPHCMAMYEGRSTCFTVLWSPVKPNDPAARGSARVVDGKLVLGLAMVPSDPVCEGEKATYAYEDAGQTLRGVHTPMPCTFPGFRELGATSSSSSPYVFDTRTISHDFALKLQLTMPPGWKPLHGIVGGLGLVHTGFPEGPDGTWWGPDFFLVEDAEIHDPSDVVSSVPARSDHSRFVPWPADFFAYITALPGVTVVSGPEPIKIGGVTGTQIVVMTPPMHPLIWLHGDTAWSGGGASGVDPAQERRFVELKAGGHTLLVQFGWDPLTFEAKDAEIRAILDSVTFE